MEDYKRLNNRINALTNSKEQEIINTQWDERTMSNENPEIRNRASMNGKVGHFETEHTEPTGEASAIAGAEATDKIGIDAFGTGLRGR